MSEPKLGPSPAQITMMGHNIHAVIGERAKKRRRRIRGLVAGGGAALAVGASVTAAALLVPPAAPDDIRYAVDCYTVPAVTEEFNRVLFLPGENDEVPFGSEFALMQCARTYERMGVEVPNPTVCELADLRLGVFPNAEGLPPEQFCTSLALGIPAH